MGNLGWFGIAAELGDFFGRVAYIPRLGIKPLVVRILDSFGWFPGEWPYEESTHFEIWSLLDLRLISFDLKLKLHLKFRLPTYPIWNQVNRSSRIWIWILENSSIYDHRRNYNDKFWNLISFKFWDFDLDLSFGI